LDIFSNAFGNPHAHIESILSVEAEKSKEKKKWECQICFGL